MEIDYSYLFNDYLEEERLAFIAAEMETLKQMAANYDGTEVMDNLDN